MPDAGVKEEDIDLIIATTVTGDYFTPSLSCLIQREIGAIGCIAFDLNAACAGFVYGFDTAKRYLQTGDGIKTVLLVASEELSKFVDYTDRSSCVLFGDGAAAFVLETAEDTTYSSFLGADGNGAKYLASRALKSENALEPIARNLIWICLKQRIISSSRTAKRSISLPQRHFQMQLSRLVQR